MNHKFLFALPEHVWRAVLSKLEPTEKLARELERLSPVVICLQESQQNAYISLLIGNLPSYR